MNPYKLNTQAIHDFIKYHDIKGLKEVADIMKISHPYLSQLMAGTRKLNEEMRLRFQLVTRKNQDQLFIPDFKAIPYTHQSFAMLKYYGVIPYNEDSMVKEMREEMPEKADERWKEQAQKDFNVSEDGRANYMKYKGLRK